MLMVTELGLCSAPHNYDISQKVEPLIISHCSYGQGNKKTKQTNNNRCQTCEIFHVHVIGVNDHQQPFKTSLLLSD